VGFKDSKTFASNPRGVRLKVLHVSEVAGKTGCFKPTRGSAERNFVSERDSVAVCFKPTRGSAERTALLASSYSSMLQTHEGFG